LLLLLLLLLLLQLSELDVLDQMPHYVPISAHLEWNLDELLERMWEYLSLVRMYVLHTSNDYCNQPIALTTKSNRIESARLGALFAVTQNHVVKFQIIMHQS
jgi:ribosome-interacting GTPase 1